MNIRLFKYLCLVLITKCNTEGINCFTKIVADGEDRWNELKNCILYVQFVFYKHQCNKTLWTLFLSLFLNRLVIYICDNFPISIAKTRLGKNAFVNKRLTDHITLPNYSWVKHLNWKLISHEKCLIYARFIFNQVCFYWVTLNRRICV
jgi:hypothetical protein